MISVVVDPAAPLRAEKLNLYLAWSSCGLEYLDQSQCVQPTLRVRKLEGRASDSMGRGVRRAEIVLLDDAQSQVAHVSTDTNGNFSFPGLAEGQFELRIDGAGFSPVRTPIYIEPAAGSSTLEIKAAYGGTACSTVEAK